MVKTLRIFSIEQVKKVSKNGHYTILLTPDVVWKVFDSFEKVSGVSQLMEKKTKYVINFVSNLLTGVVPEWLSGSVISVYLYKRKLHLISGNCLEIYVKE